MLLLASILVFLLSPGLKAVATLEGGSALEGGNVTALAFSPDGKLLAAGTEEGTVHVLKTDGLEPVARITVGDDDLRVCLFDRSGERLLVGADGGGLQFLHRTAAEWETQGGLREAGRGDVTALARSETAARWASGTSDGFVRLWSEDSPEPEGEFGLRQDVVYLGFFGRGSRLAAVGNRGRFVLWSVRDARILVERKLETNPIGRTPEVHDVAGRGNELLLSTSIRSTSRNLGMFGGSGVGPAGSDVRVTGYLVTVDARTGEAGEPVETGRRVPTLLRSAPGGRFVLTLTQTVPYGRRRSYARGKLVVWNVERGREVLAEETPTRTRALAFDARHGLAATGGDDGHVTIWNVDLRP
jgi:WD40 repeat protein